MENPNRVTDTNAHGILLHHWGEAHTVYSLILKHVTVQETTEFPLLANGSLDMTKDTGTKDDNCMKVFEFAVIRTSEEQFRCRHEYLVLRRGAHDRRGTMTPRKTASEHV